jgi:sirohydrochlorin cobaltochelatase
MLLAARKITSASLLILCLTAGMVAAADTSPANEKTAILLASFGTTVPSAVKSIAHIGEQVKKAYPGTEIRISFTSNMVRSVWKKGDLIHKSGWTRVFPTKSLMLKILSRPWVTCRKTDIAI